MTEVIVGHGVGRVVFLGQDHVLFSSFKLLECGENVGHAATSNDFQSTVCTVGQLILNRGDHLGKGEG